MSLAVEGLVARQAQGPPEAADNCKRGCARTDTGWCEAEPRRRSAWRMRLEQMMAEKKIVRRGSGPFVISGNALREGHVVWLAAGDAWAERFEAAALLQTDAEAADALARMTADRRELQVVDVHVVDVTAATGRPVPVTYRERVRAFGPTVAFGAQALAEARP